MLWSVDAALRTRSFQSLIQRAERARKCGMRDVGAQELAKAASYAHWLDRATRHHVVRAHCLHRSLALHSWLRGEGIPSELRIGVQKDGGKLRAHAWVEVVGQVVNDRAESIASFTPLALTAAGRSGDVAWS